MTNKEWLSTLPAKDCYEVMSWLFFKKGRSYIDTRLFIIGWLDELYDADRMQTEMKTWGIFLS